jgi:hypothetical protein
MVSCWGYSEIEKGNNFHHIYLLLCTPSKLIISDSRVQLISATFAIATTTLPSLQGSEFPAVFQLAMSPQSSQPSSDLPTSLTYLSDASFYRESISETIRHQPTSHGRETTFYYCCSCKNGPQVLTINPACSYCTHHACGDCRYEKW